MIHLGDITKLDGRKMPIVDVVTGGSPCQDLSVAGARAGLDGERSGLFLEQCRIVKEMREADEARKQKEGRSYEPTKPRFMVWENVQGAFTSNKGEDFQTVLTTIVRIADPAAPDVPLPKNGKWPHAGLLYSEMGDWSIAWRLFDAQFWGTPQRRKRIALVADFAGGGAGEVLFERKSLSGDSGQGGEEGEDSSGGSEGRTGETVEDRLCLNDMGGQFMSVSYNVTGTLRAQMGGHEPLVIENE